MLAQHSYQIQRRRFRDAEAGQARVRLPTVMCLVIEEMNERLPARLALRLVRPLVRSLLSRLASPSAHVDPSPPM